MMFTVRACVLHIVKLISHLFDLVSEIPTVLFFHLLCLYVSISTQPPHAPPPTLFNIPVVGTSYSPRPRLELFVRVNLPPRSVCRV